MLKVIRFANEETLSQKIRQFLLESYSISEGLLKKIVSATKTYLAGRQIDETTKQTLYAQCIESLKKESAISEEIEKTLYHLFDQCIVSTSKVGGTSWIIRAALIQ